MPANTIVLNTEPITIPDNLSKLKGTKVQYNHFADSNDLYTGEIVSAKVTMFGIEALIMPDAVAGMSLLPKYKNLATDSIVKIVE